MTSRYTFSPADRLYGKRVGLKKAEKDFRCYECVDFSFYEREADARDAEERCAYCGTFVFINPATIALIEAPKSVRIVDLSKRHAQRIDYMTSAVNLDRRLIEVSFAYDKARQKIADLEDRLREREMAAPAS
ncbi:hypothetical protein [Streptomyces sp. NPDC091278]|uniref:hypothetical protein n=1 Tax=Streptomyces sp. NPDC091278 TaxID=3155301 RepID=UPI0034507C13